MFLFHFFQDLIDGLLGGPDNLRCEKIEQNPDHHSIKNFVPAWEFGIHSFNPSKLDKAVIQKVVELVQSYIPLVVSIHSTFLSSQRPATFGDTSTSYPLEAGGDQGEPATRHGSGYVINVDGPHTVGEHGHLPYPQEADFHSQYWIIYVLTACHVLFDTDEALQSEAVLSIDKDSCVTLCGGTCVRTDTESDYSHIAYFTHDENLASRLEKCLLQCGEKRTTLKTVIQSKRINPESLPVILISHPHGGTKHISCGDNLGQWNKYGDSVLSNYASCEGSSGGLTIEVGRVAAVQTELNCEAHPDGVYGGPLNEIDNDICAKWGIDNNHHSPDRFIPIDQFGFDRYNWPIFDDPQLFEVKQCVVDWVKSQRPRVVRIELMDRDKSHHETQAILGTGSGFVVNVSDPLNVGVADEYCGCYQPAQHQDGDSFWEIEVNTANHVVPDNAQATRSQAVLFDDGGESATVTLCGGRERVLDQTRDTSLIKYYTHSQEVGDRLKAAIRQCKRKMENVKRTCKQNNVRPEMFSVFLISHPHGRQKYCSYGAKLENHGDHGDGLLATYPSCPGSSGGMTIEVGRMSEVGSYITHPHRGWQDITQEGHFTARSADWFNTE